jgi:RNA ligase (TIGR02306 family)
MNNTDIEGKDLTDELGILLYEPELPNTKEAKGVFPYFINKTDQERVQNLDDIPDNIYEITEKLDGTSCTIYYNNGETGVCSRNIELKPDMAGIYQEFYDRYKGKLEEYCQEHGRNLALQGEIVGIKLQGNPYKFNEKHFYLFDIFDIDKQEYVLPEERYNINNYLNCEHVPIVEKFGYFKGMDEEIKQADGLSLLNPTVNREGLVFKSTTQNFSFKIISNNYLLNKG